jgi:hypothetical protein
MKEVIENFGDDPAYPKDDHRYRLIANEAESVTFVEQPVLVDHLLRPAGRDKPVSIGRFLQRKGPRPLFPTFSDLASPFSDLSGSFNPPDRAPDSLRRACRDGKRKANRRLKPTGATSWKPSWYNACMASRSPGPLPPAERRARRNRAAGIARQLGFVGSVEYRHVYSQSGGVQYGRGNTPEEDLLTVYAEAFERDADPEDFSLKAMIAHECGHQILARHPRIAKRVAGLSEASEEILASLLGAMICDADADRVTLFAKAVAELLDRGQSAESANRQLQQLWDLLEALL